MTLSATLTVTSAQHVGGQTVIYVNGTQPVPAAPDTLAGEGGTVVVSASVQVPTEHPLADLHTGDTVTVSIDTGGDAPQDDSTGDASTGTPGGETPPPPPGAETTPAV